MGTELEKKLGISDKTSAEFVIDLAIGKKNSHELYDSLLEHGVELPHNIIDTLFNVINRSRLNKSQTKDKKGKFCFDDFISNKAKDINIEKVENNTYGINNLSDD